MQAIVMAFCTGASQISGFDGFTLLTPTATFTGCHGHPWMYTTDKLKGIRRRSCGHEHKI